MKTVFLAVMVGVPVALVTAAIHEPLRGALAGLFGLVQNPFIVLGELVRTALRWLAAQIGESLRPDARDPGSATGSRAWPGWPVVGALLYLAAFAAFAYAEFWLLVLTLGALFGFEAPTSPVSAELLTGLAFLGVGFFWGMVLLDVLGISSLGPWERLSQAGRRVVLIVSLLAVILTLVLAGLLGIWRMDQLTVPPPNEGGALDPAVLQTSPLSTDGDGPDVGSATELGAPESLAHSTIPRIVGAGVPVLVGVSTVGSAPVPVPWTLSRLR